MSDSVLVTDAAAGFGQEVSLILAERGFRVFAGMRDLRHAEKLAAAAAERGCDPQPVQLDVTDEDSVGEVVKHIVDSTGGLFGVVNNACVFMRGFFEDLTEEEVRSVFETNLFGTMAVTRAALAHMRPAGRGRVVIITSVAGKIGSPSGSIYSSSRFAQEGFGESLRQEIQPLGLYVSLVEPGITPTSQWTIDKGAGAHTENPDSPYYEWFKRAEAMFDEAMHSSGITTRDVALAVHRGLTDRKPRWRYMVGRRARLITALRRYIPGEIFERRYFAEVIRRVTNPKK